MTAPHTEPDGVVLDFITPEEGMELLDRQARKYLDMSGKDFATAFCAGELDTENRDVIRLYFLLGMAGIECDARPDAN